MSGVPKGRSPAPKPAPPSRRPGKDLVNGHPAPERTQRKNPPSRRPGGDFVNPYNFVPLHTGRPAASDGPPASASRWQEESYSGRIVLSLTTETPLLVMHRVRLGTRETPALLTVRRAPDGTPAINGASVKGMLRSLYEQATGSRLGVFDHGSRLTYRSSADDARGLALAKVVRHVGATLELEVFHGLRERENGRSRLVLAPWALCAGFPFGAEVYLWLELLAKNGRSVWFPNTAPANDESSAWSAEQLQVLDGWTGTGVEPVFVRARLHNTGHTLDSKRFERLFVEEVLASDRSDVPPRGLRHTEPVIATDAAPLITEWRERIESMSGDAGSTPDGRRLDLAPYGDERIRKAWAELRPDQTLFVRLDGRQIVALYPGMVTREVHRHRPSDLLPETFALADNADRMSPADRVFGWVAPEGAPAPTAYRGQLSVGGVRCATEDPIAIFPPQRLAALGSPKASQFRFYTRTKATGPAVEQQGEALDGVDTKYAFNPGKHAIAGHKVYPHHGVPQEWWRPPSTPWEPSEDAANGPAHPAVKGRPLTFLAPNGTKKQVSADIDSWVKPGVTFQTVLRFDNLSAEELGALLWIVDLDGHHRFGMAKPLGFGSLKLKVEWDATEVRTGEQLAQRYRDLNDSTTSKDDLLELRTDFDEKFRRMQPAVYRALTAAHRGYTGTHPVHYPWVEPALPQAETYQWFVSNERGAGQATSGPKHALKRLGDGGDPTLPVLPKRV